MSSSLDRTSSGSWTDTVSDASTVDPPTGMQPSALLSDLARSFVRIAFYATMTKMEIMDSIELVLHNFRDQADALFEALLSQETIMDTGHEKFLVSSEPIVGVFTPLSQCYSSACISYHNPQCYSPTCPNRTRQASILRLCDPDKKDTVDWTDRVLHGMAPGDRKSAIGELLDSERNYVRDLRILMDHYGAALLQSNSIASSRRQQFYNAVFSNATDLIHHHQRVAHDLTQPQNKKQLFDQLGTTLYNHFSLLENDYVRYCSQHMKADYMVEHERARNRNFQHFLEVQDAAQCVRKLEFRHFLTMPTQRIGKLKLLMTAIIKYTPKSDDNDYTYLVMTIHILEQIQSRMNHAVHKAEKETELLKITSSIIYPDHLSARVLFPDNVKLIRSGALSLTRSSSHSIKSVPCHVFLFSHMLLVTRQRMTDGVRELEILADPIATHMLSIGDSTSFMRRFSSLLLASPSSKAVYSILTDKDREFERSVTGLHIRSKFFRRIRNGFHRGPDVRTTRDPLVAALKQEVPLPTPPLEPTYSPPSPTSSFRIVTSPPPRPWRVVSPTCLSPHRIQSPHSFVSSHGVQYSRRFASNSRCGYTSRRKVLPYRAASPRSRAVSPDKATSTCGSTDPAKAPRSNTRILKVNHLGNHDISLKFAFDTAKERDEWIAEIRMAKQKFNEAGPIKSTPLCKLSVSANSTQIIAEDGRLKFHTGNRILCSLPFAWYDGGQVLDMIALGTQSGLRIGPCESTAEYPIVTPHDCQQVAIIDSVMLVRTKRCLMACDVDTLCHANSVSSSTISVASNYKCDPWWTIKKNVVAFAVQPEYHRLCYVYRRRSGTLSLVLLRIKPRFAYERTSLFKRSKEYRLQLETVSEIQIAHDSVLVRSLKEGVERISFTDVPPRLFFATPKNMLGLDDIVGCVQPNIQCASPLGWLCGTTEALAFAWNAESGHLADVASKRIRFESRAKSIAAIGHYMLVFSPSVIEICDRDTGKCLQSIAGHDIRCVYITQTHAQEGDEQRLNRPVIHYTTINPDERVMQVCELSLKSRSNYT